MVGGKLRAQFEELPARVPMTTDWWVALAVEDNTGSRVVCDEDGEEWRALRDAERVHTWKEAYARLQGARPGDPRRGALRTRRDGDVT